MKVDLTAGRFLRRYKRFFADVELESGEVVTAHCPNTGSMKTLLREGAPAWLTHHDDPKRKLAWTLTLLGVRRRGRALVDTALPNRLVATAVEAGRIPELAGYDTLRREVPYGDRSRIDLLLEGGADPRPCWIEIKNCTMSSEVSARRCDFPDSPTTRGLKHLREMSRLARSGARVVQFFLLSRTDCDHCGVAEQIDPDYAGALREAMADGVEVLCYRLDIRRDRLRTGLRCSFDFR